MQNRADRISKCKMIQFDDVTNKNNTEHNSDWPYIPDHPYRLLIIKLNTQMIFMMYMKILKNIILEKNAKY